MLTPYRTPALLKLREEQLDRERTGIALVRELAKHRIQRGHAITRDDPRVVVEQFTRQVGYILEVDVLNLARANLIHIFEFIKAGLEVIEVEHDTEVWVSGLARDLERGG
jgi:hypothetical protein